MSVGEAGPAQRPERTTADGTRRLPELDGVRSYALLAIFLVHMLGASGVIRAHNGTDSGVVIWGAFGSTLDAFFIVSAFVLFLPAVRRGGELGSAIRFWVKRAVRLLPAYWFVLAMALLLLAVAPPLPEPALSFPPLHSIAAHLGVAQLPVRLVDGSMQPGFGLDGPVWMLSIVVTFYFLLPLVAGGFYRHPVLGLGIAAAVTVAWKEVVERVPGPFVALSDGSLNEHTVQLIAIDQFPGWAFSFALGMFCAWAYVWLGARYEPDRLARFALLAAPVALLVYLYGAWLFGNTTLVTPGRIGAAARSESLDTMVGTLARGMLIMIVVLGPLWIRRPFDNRLTRFLAPLTYGVYLVHIVVGLYAATLFGLPQDGTLWALLLWIGVVLPPSLLLAALIRRWVEVPVQRWVRERQSRPPPQAPPAGRRPASAQPPVG